MRWIYTPRVSAGSFIPKYNALFAVKPASPTNFHRILSLAEQNSLDGIFARQDIRIVQNDFTISYQKQWYQLLNEQPVTVCKRDEVIVEERLNGEIKIRLRGKYLNYQILPQRPLKSVEHPWVLAATEVGVSEKKTQHKPAPNHPWRKLSLNHKKNYAY